MLRRNDPTFHGTQDRGCLQTIAKAWFTGDTSKNIITKAKSERMKIEGAFVHWLETVTWDSRDADSRQ